MFIGQSYTFEVLSLLILMFIITYQKIQGTSNDTKENKKWTDY